MADSPAKWYLVMNISSLFDWAVAITVYKLIDHTFGWVLLVCALLADIGRGIRIHRIGD